MSAWDDLVSAATVGVGGKALDLGDFDPAIADTVALIDSTDPVAATFSIAALDTVAARAGMPPGPEVEPLPPAPPDGQPIVNERLAGLLGQALQSGDELATWAIEALASRGLRVAPELIPALLQRTTRNVRIRPAIAVLVGERGRWLAQVSDIPAVLPARDAAAGPEVDAEEVWSFGSSAGRVETLRRWRSEDPNRARQRLEAVWKSEPGDVRAELLGALETALSAADEEFLERALDDRKGSVRAVAIRLLILLPESALQQRMTERARGILVGTRRLGRFHLTLTLPDGVDPATTRDGIDPTPPRGTGAGTWLAGQILASTPLSLWEDIFDKDPSALVNAVADDDAAIVLGAWSAAAIVRRDARWAQALYRWKDAEPDLVGVLVGQAQAEAAVWWLRHRRPPGHVLPHLPTPWPDDVAAAALNIALRESISSSGTPLWHWRGLVDHLRIGLPVGPGYRWIEQIDAVSERMNNGWPQLLTPLKWALTVRTAITEEML